MGTAEPALSFNWQGPNNFGSNLPSPEVVLPGLYQLIFTSIYGCTASAAFTVFADLTVPELHAEGGTLTCAQSTTTLTAVSATQDVVLTWLGNSWPVNQSSVTVSEPGEYSVLASGPNGCTNTLTVSVVDSCITGLHDPVKQISPALLLYPNASSGIVFVKAIGTQGFESLRIHASDGRLLLMQEYNAPQNLQQLDLTNWPTGMYPVSARMDGRRWTVRLMLVK